MNSQHPGTVFTSRDRIAPMLRELARLLQERAADFALCTAGRAQSAPKPPRPAAQSPE